MSPTRRSSPNGPQFRPNRACQFCRARKIRCDTVKPSCGSCQAHGRRCIYVIEPPKQRPSRALINEANRQKIALENVILALKNTDPKERDGILNSVAIKNGSLDLTNFQDPERWQSAISAIAPNDEPLDPSSDDEDYDPTPFLSRDECGALGAFGPSSTFHVGSPISQTESLDSKNRSEIDRHRLIANAALQRQKEYDLLRQPSIAGLPSDLAIHLLDLHWNRQHHTFLLTYRPAFMRDLVQGGSYCSDFLVNAVFACSSKFSERLEVRSDPARPETAGKLFFDRCDQLLAEQSLLTHSSIPTVAGLLMLGSTFNARGQISKGWLYTGYALRMVYDLGLHLDCKEVAGSAEDVEIRRRLFWGAFICDKLQSLYFGRPFTLQLRDAHVSRDFMDTFEENELWIPYIDPKIPNNDLVNPSSPTRIYSVSVFQHLCSLSKIMTTIIDRFYVVGATGEVARKHLDMIDQRLTAWYRKLPANLHFEPWAGNEPETQPGAAPNNIILLTTFNALIILLHRPFIITGHLQSTDSPANSWERCITAARNITSLALAYRSAYSLRRANYMLSYAVYVACTIHARNPTIKETTRRRDATSPLTICLRCLDELAIPNCGVSAPAKIIRRLMEANNIPPEPEPDINVPHTMDVNLDFQSFATLELPGLADDETQYSIFPEFTQDLDLLFGFMNEPLATSTDFAELNHASSQPT
ncbi:nitrogen assimilation transcription factor NirA [Penicillium pulvis]|uniref:nitrogen assimilation transcription factor NirA n=1 Tax=Penicillium pulvis TaxID=1562058 RepID=UPI00254975BF|nr:nitrogen assimilation transcription factor NirA [Penicillium pulvis]KAJ5784249.1 nitrogen assimilation transcription factor NirA [Penicillium pulvis]